jgi:RNA recognition motif-containing protein
MASKVFVGNLDFKTTRDQLEAMFAEIGRPVDVFLPMDRASGRPRGFAFVEFETEDQARQAIARFNDHELDGRRLRLNPAEDRPRRVPSFGDGATALFGGSGGGFPVKSKGSRRNLRARKRSL